jgi:hypothetical protein
MTIEPRSRTAKPHKNDTPINGVLGHRLLLYALAAGATLACTVTSQAEVIFTPSSAVLHGTGKLGIDLDNDGAVDITIRVWRCESFSGYGQIVGCISAYGALNLGEIETSHFSPRAAALTRGIKVGPSNGFGARAFMGSGFPSESDGHWTHVANRFLGARFVINGETHFGWIGFRSVYGTYVLTAKLAGWAYETNPDTPIVTGSGGTGTAAIEPTSLEFLASGHTAVADRRKRNTP